MKSRIICVVFTLIVGAMVTSGQTTEISYQGYLQNGGSAANGNYDFEFLLFDSLAGPTQIGPTLTRSNVTVENGIFSVKLDFGSVFPGADRYIEVHVRLAGQPGITILAPRQLINSTPYAVKSINAEQLGGSDANQYVFTTDPRLSDARPPTANSTNYVQNTSVQQASSNFNVSGTGTANIINAGTQYNIGGSRLITAASGQENTSLGLNAGNTVIAGLRNSYFGRGAGANNVNGSDNSYFGRNAGNNATSSANSFFGELAGALTTLGAQNSFFGKSAGFDNSEGNGNTFVGFGSGSNNTTGSNNSTFGNDAEVQTGVLNFATAIGSRSVVNASDTIVLGKAAGTYNGTPRPADSIQVPGNLNVAGTMTANGSGLTNLDASNIATGTLNLARLNNGVILNGAAPQSASNFNISGTGTANILNAATQYNFGGSRFIAAGGTGNTALGINTGDTAGIVIGSRNSYFGHAAGTNNDFGSENSYFGQNAGAGNTQGDHNTSVGNESGSTNTSGNYNSTFGHRADVQTGNLSFATALGAWARVGTNDTIVLGKVAGNYSFQQRPADAVQVPGTLTVAGNVAIGIAAPSARLHVVGVSSAIDVPIAIVESSGTQVPLAFRSGANEAIIRSDDGGNLVFATVLGTGKDMYFRAGSDAATTDLFIESTNGNVAIGTTAPADKLDVDGDLRIGTSGTSGCLKNNNGGTIVGACSSDRRFKTSIMPFADTLDQLTKLQPVHYYWRTAEFPEKHFGVEQNYGLIAQDVEQVLPELVSVDAQGFKQVDYSKLPLLTIQAIKEQQAQIEKLAEQNRRQQLMIESLVRSICKQDPSDAVCHE